jgi:uncharacterized protein YkwD
MKVLLVSIPVLLLVSVSCFGQDYFIEYCYSNNKKIVSELNIDSLENVLFKKINDFRIQNGLYVLVMDESLNKYSEKWSRNMLSKDKIYHSSIGENGIVSENVYFTKGFGVFPMEKKDILMISDKIFKSWVNSEKHRNNMLLENVENIGVSIVLLPNGMIDESATMVVN